MHRHPRALWALTLLTLLLGSLGGCAAHEHLHVYGRVYDVSGPRKARLADAELWVVDAAGVPLRAAGQSDARGDYELELSPAERQGGVGLRKAGYRAEWWPLGELSREERRAHTKRLVLWAIKEGAERSNPRRAGSPMAEPSAAPAAAEPAGEKQAGEASAGEPPPRGAPQPPK